MNDITALAQSLKNSASKAMIEEGLTWFSEEQLSHEDGIALHKADAEFIALANPANVLALVEALEKAQQKNTELNQRNTALTAKIEPMDRRIAELETVATEPVMYQARMWNPLYDEWDPWAECSANAFEVFSQEAESGEGMEVRKLYAASPTLESRTVTVKLPDINEYLADVHDKTLALAFRRLAEGVREGDVAAMRAAGIQVIEGEGQ